MTTHLDQHQTANKPKQAANLMTRVLVVFLKFWLGLLLVIVVVLGFALTPWGTKALVGTANDLVKGLTIDHHSGGLGSDLHLSSIQLRQPTSQIDIRDLRLSLQLSCVWRLALCIESLSTAKTVVKVKASETAPKEEPAALPLTLPLPVSIKSLSLNNTAIEVQDTADVSLLKLTGKLDFFQRLRIENMQLQGLNVTTYSPKAPPAAASEPFNWTTWQYQPITAQPVVLPLHFDVLAFTLTDASLNLAGQEKIQLDRVSLQAKGTKKKVQLEKLQLVHAKGQLQVKGNVQLNGQFEHNVSLDANAQLMESNPFALQLRSSGNIRSLSAQLELSETASTIKNSKGEPQAEAAKLTLDLTAQPAKATLPIDIRVDWRALHWPLVKPEFRSDKGVIDISGDLNALKMKIQAVLSGSNLPQSSIQLNALGVSTTQNKRLELTELLLETLDGQVKTQGQLVFSEFIDWQGRSTISHIDPGVFWPQLVADINGVIATQANNSQDLWKAKLTELDINGEWQGYPLSASGSIDFQQNKGLQINELSLKNAENVLSLSGDVSKQQELAINFSLIAQELGYTLPQLGGAVNLVGVLSGTTEQPEASYELTASELLFSNVFVEQALGKGKIKWDEQKPIDISLELTGIQGVSNQLDSAQLLLTGNANDHQLALTTAGQNTSVNLSIQGQLNQTSWQGNWLSGDLKSSYANLTLIDPFSINADWGNQQYLIAPHCWQHSYNELCINQAEFKQDTLSWDISLKEFDLLSVIRRLMPTVPRIQTDSRLNLDMAGQWDIEQLPNASLKASLSAGDWVFHEQNALQLKLDKTTVNAQLTPQNILADISLSGEELGTLSASLKGQAGVYPDPLDRPLDGELVIGQLNIAAFKALFPQLDVLKGSINGQAQVEGTLGKPLFSGELTLAGGALKDETLPVALSEIEQSISLQGQSAELQGSYKLGRGLGKMDGNIAWAPTLKGQVRVSGKELEFDYQSMVKAQVSPDITLIFEPNNLQVKGEVAIPYARVKVKDLPEGSISPSKDVVLVEREAEQQASQQKLGLDLVLKVDPARANQVKLDAFGLTTDLQGTLRLYDNKSEIFGSGEIRLVNGRYRAYGQNLLIREGDILFTSSLDRPYLNVEAIRDPDLTADGVVAGLKIEGGTENPQVSVFSEPSMEQQQALSYILTGRGLGESSGDSQDTMLTNALLSLSLGKSENLVNKVGNKLGFEDVNLDTSGEGKDTQLSLSGTIAPGVQLRYGVGVFDAPSEVAIRYELMPKLYIEAVSGVSNAIDLYYQFSIEGSENKKFEDD